MLPEGVNSRRPAFLPGKEYAMLTISGKALGRKKPLFADWSVLLAPELSGDGRLSLRRLIEFVVRAEVAAFRQRQGEQRLLKALTARQIAEGVERGKVEMGGRESDPQPVDEEAAVGTALQAFEDGLFLVVVDGREHRSLADSIAVGPESRVTFVRLSLLAGG
jgi:hypothetical protein